MAKKKSTKKAKSKKASKSVKITREEYLKHLILVSERAITNQGSSVDDFFRNQADRLRKELKELRNGVRS